MSRQDFDFDNQILAHEKYDAKKTCKMNGGYFPGVATIGKFRNYRLVVMREESDDQQLDLFDGKFKYRCILTNDHRSSETGVIEYYNQRGESEKLFDIRNNNFGWSRLPTSDMSSNTVFLIITSNFPLSLTRNFLRI
jgi:hypothetical protein